MEHWRFLQSHRRDAAIIKGIQERVVALVDIAQLSIAEPPETVVPFQADDNALSALDKEIAVMQQVTSAVLAGPNNTVTASISSGQPGRTGVEGELLAGGSWVPGV